MRCQKLVYQVSSTFRHSTGANDIEILQGMMGQALGNPKVDWAFSTVEQEAVLNRKIFSPR